MKVKDKVALLARNKRKAKREGSGYFYKFSSDLKIAQQKALKETP
jgi:hypothetical protein